jgi:hypothetical protein
MLSMNTKNPMKPMLEMPSITPDAGLSSLKWSASLSRGRVRRPSGLLPAGASWLPGSAANVRGRGTMGVLVVVGPTRAGLRHRGSR